MYAPMYVTSTASAATKSRSSTAAQQETQSLDQLLAKQGITIEEPVKAKANKKKTKEKEAIDISDIVGKG